MKHGLLTLHLDHYWHCGSGQAGEGDVDLLPVVEASGLPYVPGRAIRGRLKWAAREAGWSEEMLHGFFGHESSRSLKATGRLCVANGTMRDAFAIKVRQYQAANGHPDPAIAALFEDIASTALTDGVATSRSLRRVRYAVPVSVVAEVSLDENGEVTWEHLQELVGRLRAIGKGKHDGFGWCRAELSEENPKDDPKGATAARLDLELELIDDVVLSASSATVGGHRTLDHVPGSALLGVAARGLFQKLGETAGAQALLSGQVRFGNAVPVGSEVEATMPMPLSWHHAKDVRSVDQHQIDPKTVSDLAVISYEQSKLRGRQPVQMRGGWLDPAAGRIIPVPRTQTLKTAIDPDLGKYETAMKSALYGYEAIAKGARFISRIEADREDLMDMLKEAFDGKTIRLGRSKGTEFGRARCSLRPALVQEPAIPQGDLVLLAESDLALLDEHGLPTLHPLPSHLGLDPAWTLCEERTHLRFRRYSLWNALRGGPDVERQVISKGSVLVFSGGNSTQGLRLRIGLGQAEGLGRLRLLSSPQSTPGAAPSEHPVFVRPGAEPPKPEPEEPRLVGEDLSKWVQARHEEKNFPITAYQLARQWSMDWSRTARRQKARISASQWNRLGEVARDAADKAHLLEQLGAPEKTNIHTVFGHGRMREEWGKGAKRSVAHAVSESLTQTGSSPLALAAFQIACRLLAAEKRRERD